MLPTLPSSQWTVYQAAHLLNRAGFGGTPEEIAALHQLGMQEAVNRLLKGEEDDDLFPPPRLTPSEEVAARQKELRAAGSEKERQELRTTFRLKDRGQMNGLRAWWLNRMRYSLHPVREKMTLFWHGHFATSEEKVRLPLLLWRQNETLRAGALGSFRRLTKDISRDPAMMRYLDTIKSEPKNPNENFARELLELFTLGEGVLYTEKDVRECARAFTGYRIRLDTQQFDFVRRRFDASPKEFLGQSGPFDGNAIIDIITTKPENAEFIARKIWVFLAYDNPSDKIVKELGASFQKSGHDVSLLLREILSSEEFYSPRAVRRQIKSPVQWIVQTARTLDLPLPNSGMMETALRQMGQVPFAPPNVKGWEGGRTWISSSTLLYRYNLARFMVGNDRAAARTELALDKIVPSDIRSNPSRVCDVVSFRLFNAPLSEKERARFVEFLEKQKGTLDDATLRDFLHLMMSTPEYQLT